MTTKRIVEVKVLEGYRVWLRFNDGIDGVIDFSRKPHTGVYATWADYEAFRRASIGECGELRWNDQLDFCPDSLWLKVTGKSATDLRNEQKPTATHA